MNDSPQKSEEVFAHLQELLQAITRQYFEEPERPLALKAAIMATIFDCIADGLLVFDENQTIVLANVAAAELARWDVESLKNLTRPEFRQKFQLFKDNEQTPLPHEDEAIVVAMRTKKHYETEGFVKGETLPTDGIWARAHAAPILNENGDVLGGVTVFHDITTRRKLEQQRDCLTALITHDIKNHLAANVILIDLLKGLLVNQLDEETLSLMNDLKKDNEWFFDVSNSLVEMSRAQFFDVEMYGKTIDLDPVLRSLVELNNPSAHAAGISFNVEATGGATTVRVVPAAIRHIFHNIIQNAVAASSRGSTIDITVSQNISTNNVEVRVADHGRGMSPQVIDGLFDAKQVAAISKTTRSSGFGLYLSAMMLEAQGGKISCRSELGTGTEILVSLPVSLKTD